MNVPDSLQWLLFIALTLLSVWNPRAGVLYLLGGLVLFDRNFAYCQLHVKGVSLFIVEYGLALLLLRQTITQPKRWLEVWQEWPAVYRWAWVMWLAVAGLSVLRGWTAHEPHARILRDSMLVFYSLVVPLLLTMEWKSEHLQKASHLLLALVLIKTIAGLYTGLPDLPGAWYANLVFGQPAAFSLVLSLALLTVFSVWAIRFPGLGLYFFLFLMGASILLGEVRSSWIGLFAAWVVMTALWAQALSEKIQVYSRSAGHFFILGIGSWLFLAVISLWSIGVQTPPTLANVVRAPVAATAAAKATAGGGLPVIVAPSLTSPKNHAAKTSEPLSALASPAAAPAESPFLSRLQLVINEFSTLFAGFQTDNGSTRLWMWRDAWMDLTTTGLYAPILFHSFEKYNVIWSLNESTPTHLRVNVSGTGLEHEPLWVHIRRPGDAPPNMKDRARQIFKAAFGIPFGRLFLPIEVVWRVNSPQRYDPHNSWVAVLYRTGIVGFTCFFILLIAAGRRIYKRRSALAITAFTGAVYVLVHALTDNVLENSFKGLWLWVWIAIGFIAARSVPERSPH